MSGNSMIAIGLMSGTSADGIDAALVQTDGENEFQFVDFLSVPYQPAFREQLICCARDSYLESQIDEVEKQLTDLHANAVIELQGRNSAKAQLIGFHGHTIRHDPARGVTRQIGDGQRLAKSCGVPVVYDFRSKDIRAGGQGAPLAPLFHAMLFADQPQPYAVVNIGGVANATCIDGSTLVAGDTGPGCGLLDAWATATTGDGFDRDGKLAKHGKVDVNVIDKLNTLAFFQQPFPKSADRYDFQAISVDHLSPADGAATLCEVTALTIANAILKTGAPETTWVTGGGTKHPVIMQRLTHYLGDVRNVDTIGLRGDSLEAECFAWLAVRRMRDLPTTLPSTTGCHHPTCGGRIA